MFYVIDLNVLLGKALSKGYRKFIIGYNIINMHDGQVKCRLCIRSSIIIPLQHTV